MECFPDMIAMLRLMPLCLQFNKMPHTDILEEEDVWTLDFMQMFLIAKQKREEYERKKISSGF
jgi:hypothetical protein